LNWNERIFAYCERAGDPAFWAEPFNAVSNGAFLVAAALALVLLLGQRDRERQTAEALLVALTFVIGIGSFLFHTYATRWASVADTAPIGVFMLTYLGYAVRRFLGQSWLVTGLALAVFLLAMRGVEMLPCDPGLLPITEAAGRPCLNGSLGYVPAAIALVAIGAILLGRGHPAGRLVLLGGFVFAASLTLRSLDYEVCALTEILGRARGTHAAWHLLNATLLYLLLRAAIRHGRRAAAGAALT
jgi:hypothetical protein